MKKFWLVLSAILITSTVHAQEKEYVLKLTAAQLNIIASGIEGLPYRNAAPVIFEIQKQISEQQSQKPEDKK